MSNEAFVYRWRHTIDDTWYIGYHKGHPDDGYICSSTTAKPAIEAEPNLWERKILRFGTRKQMQALEIKLLNKLNARDNPKSFNRCNGFPPVTKRKFKLRIVGAHSNTYHLPSNFNNPIKRLTGHVFEYHYLKDFFTNVKEQDRYQTIAMLEGIDKLFGIKLELYYD